MQNFLNYRGIFCWLVIIFSFHQMVWAQIILSDIQDPLGGKRRRPDIGAPDLGLNETATKKRSGIEGERQVSAGAPGGLPQGEVPLKPVKWADIKILMLVGALGDQDYRKREDAKIALLKLGRAAVDSLIQGLTHKNSAIRRQSAELLGRIGDSNAVEPLIQLAQSDKEVSVRRATVTALMAIGDVRALPALVNALGDSDSSVRSDARNAVKNFKEAAIPELINGLKSSNVQVRIDSVFLLADLKATAAVELLIQLVQSDKEISVRRAGVTTLGTIGDVRALPVLVSALGDGDPLVRSDARNAVKNFKEATIPELINGLKNNNVQVRLDSISLLVEMKATAAVEPLMQLVQLDKEGEVRGAAVKALGAIGDVRALPVLVAALGDSDYNTSRFYAPGAVKSFKEQAVPELIKGLKHEKKEVRSGAAIVLGEMKATAAVEPLMQLVQQDKEISVRRAGVTALGTIGDVRALPVLVSALGDGDPLVRSDARNAVKNFKEAAIPELINGLKNSNVQVRLGSISLLTDLKATAAVEPLMELVQQDKETSVRRVAVTALVAIGDARALPSLVAALGDSDSSVRNTARNAMKSFKELAIPELLKGLKHEKKEVRSGAAGVLGEMKAVAGVEALMEVVQTDKEGEVRGAAVRALGSIGDVRALPVLVEALGDSDYNTSRFYAPDAVKSFKEAAIPELLKGLKHEKKEVRSGAAVVLGTMKAVGAVEALMEVVQTDKEGEVRGAAVRALGTIGDVRALPVLVEALGDSDYNTSRFYAPDAVKSFKETAVPELAKAVFDNQRPTLIRSRAIEILGEIKVVSAIETLITIINKGKNENVSIRVQAIRALGKTGDPKVVPILIPLIKSDEEEIGIVAISALADIKDPIAIPVIVEFLRDPSPEIRSAAAEALGVFKDRQAVAPLMEVLNDVSERVAARAAVALGAIGDPTAIEPLLKMAIANQPRGTSKLKWWSAMTALRQIPGAYQSATIKKTVETVTSAPVGGIVPPAEFTVFSAGYLDGWSVGFSKNDKRVFVSAGAERDAIDVNSNTILQTPRLETYIYRGYRIIVINEKTGEVERVGHFDLWIDDTKRAAKLMADFINEIPDGRIVLVGVIDEGHDNLTQEAIQALKSLGSILIDRIGFRDSFALIGRKGAAPGSAIEFLTPSTWGTVTVSTNVMVAKYYDAQGNLIYTDVSPAPGVDLKP